MQKIILFLIAGFFSLHVISQEKPKIDRVLNEWHQAAAQANFKEYFNSMTPDGVFIGTDATENWQNKDFKKFSKPYFDRGSAWSFEPLERNIYTKKNTKIAWFDELLATQMGICRGSGVLEKTKDGWKIAHYVLSITIPNENVSAVTKLKKKFDKDFITSHNNEK